MYPEPGLVTAGSCSCPGLQPPPVLARPLGPSLRPFLTPWGPLSHPAPTPSLPVSAGQSVAKVCWKVNGLKRAMRPHFTPLRTAASTRAQRPGSQASNTPSQESPWAVLRGVRYALGWRVFSRDGCRLKDIVATKATTVLPHTGHAPTNRNI